MGFLLSPTIRFRLEDLFTGVFSTFVAGTFVSLYPGSEVDWWGAGGEDEFPGIMFDSESE
jgi:hypothetical protein